MQWGCPPRVLSPCTGPKTDGHACPGSREYRAGGQQTKDLIKKIMEMAVLLARDAFEPVPPAKVR